MMGTRRGRRGLEAALGFVLLAMVLALLPASAAATGSHQDPPDVINRGTASRPLRLVALIPTDYPNARTFGRFVKALPKSAWFAAIQRTYPLYQGAPANLSSTVTYVDDMPGMVTRDRTVGSYQDYIFEHARAAGLAADPLRQTIYVLAIPCQDPHGMDTFGCTSHHPALDPNRTSPTHQTESLLFTRGDSMALLLRTDADRDNATALISHEVAEAYTNTPGVGGWRLHSSFPSDPWLDASAWVSSAGNIEMMDMAAGSAWYEKDPVSGKTFKYQRAYAPYRAAHGFNDWMVPNSPYPQYNVSDKRGSYPNGWHHYASGGGPTLSIPMTAWAEPGVGNFTVIASIRTSGGPPGTPCVLPTRRWTVRDGSTFTLKVNTAPLESGQHLWCGIQLTSTRSAASPHDDASHWWVVGVLVAAP